MKTKKATVENSSAANTMAAALVKAMKEVDEAVVAPAVEAAEPAIKDVVFTAVEAAPATEEKTWKKVLKWTGIGLAAIATVGAAMAAISSLCSSESEEESIEAAESQEALANA